MADLIENADVDEAPSNLAVAARHVFSPAIFDYLRETEPGKGGEIQLTDAIRALIHDGGRVMGVRLPARQSRFDIGNFGSYFRAFIEFAIADPAYGKQVKEYMRQLLADRGEVE